MLRTRWMLLASAFAVTPAFAQQTNVGAVRRDTTIRIVRGEVMMSAAEMRKLKEIIAQLITRNAQREAQLLSDATQSRRSIEAQEELEVAALEVMSKQRQLAFACAFARPSAGLPGTIGIDVDTAESVRWTWGLGPGKGSLTMRFGNKPPTVKSVAENSPAEKAGVRPGDVWVSVNGRLLVGEVRFDELLNPGTNVVLRVSRGGRDIDLPAVPVAKQPVTDTPSYPADVCEIALSGDALSLPFISPGAASGGVRMAPVRPQLPSASVGPQMFMLRMAGPSVYGGATLQPLDDDWRDNMGVQGEGVGVFEVPRGSPAEAWGLRKFDVIRQVNGENVTSIAVFARLVREPGAVVLTLSNRQGTRTVTIGR